MLLANYDCQHYWKNIDKFGAISKVSVPLWQDSNTYNSKLTQYLELD